MNSLISDDVRESNDAELITEAPGIGVQPCQPLQRYIDRSYRADNGLPIIAFQVRRMDEDHDLSYSIETLLGRHTLHQKRENV